MIKTKVNKLIENGLKVTVYLLYASLLVACANGLNAAATTTSSTTTSGETSSHTVVELIKDNEFTEIPSYYVFPNASGKVIDSWLSTEANVSVGETAVYIDFSKLTGVALKAGDLLSVSLSLSNGNYGSLA